MLVVFLVSGCHVSGEHMLVKNFILDSTKLTYATIRPIFERRCSACHNSTSLMPNWLNYDVAYAKRDRILERVTVKKDMPMPPYNTAITDDERALIGAWINAGAPNIETTGSTPVPTPTATPGPIIVPHDCTEKLGPDLVAAVYSGNATNVDNLLTQGACPKTKDDKGRAVLLTAILDQGSAGPNPDFAHIVTSLVAAGADLNVSYNGGTALIWAEFNDDNKIAPILIEKGADVNAQVTTGDDTLTVGYTSLMLAVQNVEPDAVNLLLSSGANPMLKAANGDTAVSLASQITGVKKPVIVQLLNAYLDGGQLNSLSYTKDIQTIFQQRCSKCHNESTPAFNWLDYQAAYRKKALIYVRAVVIKDMPMDGNVTKITDDERALIGRWIQAGAPK